MHLVAGPWHQDCAIAESVMSDVDQGSMHKLL